MSKYLCNVGLAMKCRIVYNFEQFYHGNRKLRLCSY